MARPLRIEYPSAFYHVTQRGIERKNIYSSDQDRERFLSYLASANTSYNAIFHTYILMNNHYHFILETPRGNLSKIMHYLNASYAVYFNANHKRVGPIYQGRYKAILVQQDEYLHHLSRYIHLNPIRAGITKSPEEYPWSSYRYFISTQNQPKWLNIDLILSMFDDKSISKAKRLYKQFVLDGIGEENLIIKQNTLKGIILGNQDFFNSIKAKVIDKREDQEIPLLRELKQKDEPPLEYIKDAVMRNVDNKRLQRKLSIYLSRKFTQKTLNQIAAFYGRIRDTGVSQVFSRTQKAREEDKGLNTLLLKMERSINV